jgi:G3E family GTPase
MKAHGESFIQLLSDSMRKIEEDERLADIQNELDLVRMMEEEQPPAHFKNEGDSERNLAMRAEQCLRFQQLEYIMPLKVGEDEDKNDAHFHDQQNSVRTMEEEDEYDAHSQNEMDLVRNLAMREEQCLRFQQLVDIVPTIMEDDAQFQDQLNSVRTMEMEEKEWGCTIRLFGMNSLKEGAVWRICSMQELLRHARNGRVTDCISALLGDSSVNAWIV